MNLLRNDAAGALGIAAAAGARFIRVNVHTGVMATDQGLLRAARGRPSACGPGSAPRWRSSPTSWGVKHAASFPGSELEDAAEDTFRRGLADALIVSGRATGKKTDLALVDLVKRAVPEAPVLIGSGLTPETAPEALAVADGAIVGSTLQQDGRAGNPVDPRRAAARSRPSVDGELDGSITSRGQPLGRGRGNPDLVGQSSVPASLLLKLPSTPAGGSLLGTVPSLVVRQGRRLLRRAAGPGIRGDHGWGAIGARACGALLPAGELPRLLPRLSLVVAAPGLVLDDSRLALRAALALCLSARLPRLLVPRRCSASGSFSADRAIWGPRRRPSAQRAHGEWGVRPGACGPGTSWKSGTTWIGRGSKPCSARHPGPRLGELHAPQGEASAGPADRVDGPATLGAQL